MKKGIQSFFLAAGKNGCYCFCIIKIAERILKAELDPQSALQAGIDNKFIRVNEKNYSQGDNFYVLEPAKFLTYLSGWKCDVKKENPEYKAKQGETVVECWECNGRVHFRLPDWDPLENSQTVKYGKVKSLRVFYPLG